MGPGNTSRWTSPDPTIHLLGPSQEGVERRDLFEGPGEYRGWPHSDLVTAQGGHPIRIKLRLTCEVWTLLSFQLMMETRIIGLRFKK